MRRSCRSTPINCWYFCRKSDCCSCSRWLGVAGAAVRAAADSRELGVGVLIGPALLGRLWPDVSGWFSVGPGAELLLVAVVGNPGRGAYLADGSAADRIRAAPGGDLTAKEFEALSLA